MDAVKSLVVVGVVLIGIGLAGLLYGGVVYHRTHETADLGIVKFTVVEDKRWALHPVLGGVILAAGIVVLVVARKTSPR